MKQLGLVTALIASLIMASGPVAYATHAGASHFTSGKPAKAHPPSKKAFPVTIVDDLNNRIRITRQPKRIVSLDPRDTETLFALGVEKRVVGDGTHGPGGEGANGLKRAFRYPSEWPSPFGRDYPVRAKQLPAIEGGCCGTPFNLETVESLHPDLVISLNSDLQTIQKMRDLGLKVIILDPANFAGILRDIQVVAKATGAVKQGRMVVGAMKKRVKEIGRGLAHVRSHPKAYYEIDATNPSEPYVAGPGTFIDEAVRKASARNVASGVTAPGCPGKGCYPQLSLEALVRLDPQVVILGDANYGTTVASVKSRTGWSTISAVQRGRIYPFDDDLISRAGPRIVIGLQKLARLIHPEAFRKRSD